MSQLLPCPSCRRHVRASASKCPFCGEIIMRAQGARPATDPRERMSRGNVFLFGALSSAIAVAGCGSSGSEPAPSVTDTGSKSDGTSDAVDTGGVAPAYGAPADTGTTDSGSSGDAGDSGDAKDTGGGAALYGAAPFR